MECFPPQLNVKDAIREYGWWILREAVSRESVERIRKWLSVRSACAFGNPALEPEFEADPSAPDNPAVRKLRRLFWNDPDFWTEILETAGIFRLAQEHVGNDAALVFHAAFLKPANVGSRVIFHQDQALWRYSYPHSINVWLALSPCRPDNGCLQFCTRSHLKGTYPHRAFSDSPFHVGVDPWELGFVPEPAVMDAGDIALWDRHTIHGSFENRTRDNRESIVMVFVDGSGADFQYTDCYRVPRPKH